MALDSLVIGIAKSEEPFLVGNVIAGVLDGDLEIIRHARQWPTAQQLARWALLTNVKNDNAEKQPLHPATTYAAILHINGQEIVIWKNARSEFTQIAFHGIQQYQRKQYKLTEGALERGSILLKFLNLWPEKVAIYQADICKDFFGKSLENFKNGRQHRKLCKRHSLNNEKCRGTVFYQPYKPKPYYKLIAYDKQIKHHLHYPLMRFEVSARRVFFKSMHEIETFNLLEIVTEKVEIKAVKEGVSLK